MEMRQHAALAGEAKSEVDPEAGAPLLQEERVANHDDVVRYLDEVVPGVDERIAELLRHVPTATHNDADHLLLVRRQTLPEPLPCFARGAPLVRLASAARGAAGMARARGGRALEGLEWEARRPAEQPPHPMGGRGRHAPQGRVCGEPRGMRY